MTLLTHREHENRPWGSYERFTHNEPATVKLVFVAAGQRLSLQYHKQRSEFWRIIAGDGVASIDGKDVPVKPGDEIEISAGMTHRLQGGPVGVTVLEISFGDFDESDNVRLEDDYGRGSPTP